MAHLLIVDDDAAIRRMLSLRLQMRGHTIDDAGNGNEGVEKALKGNHDCVIMDMHMPVMDGHEATKKLRDQGYSKPIIAVTASVMVRDTKKALESGCDSFIAKPIDETFEDKIDEVLSKSTAE